MSSTPRDLERFFFIIIRSHMFLYKKYNKICTGYFYRGVGPLFINKHLFVSIPPPP